MADLASLIIIILSIFQFMPFIHDIHGNSFTEKVLLANKNKKFRSFKSKENINKAENGSYLGFGYKSLISDPLRSGNRSQRKIL